MLVIILSSLFVHVIICLHCACYHFVFIVCVGYHFVFIVCACYHLSSLLMLVNILSSLFVLFMICLHCLILFVLFQYGDSALHTAARYGHAGVTRILVSARCNINEQNKVCTIIYKR